MSRIVVYACILTGLFYFSEGKPCPYRTRAHKTRCDVYFKCTELPAPSTAHVWSPANCEQGLVYEHKVGNCVVPGEDWECVPGELEVPPVHSKMKRNAHERPRSEEDIDIVDTPEEADPLSTEEHQPRRHSDDGTVEIILDAGLSSEEDDAQEVEDETQHDDGAHSSATSGGQFDSSGDGELVELDGFLQAENRETEDHHHSLEHFDHHHVDLPAHKEAAIDELAAELKQVNDAQKSPSSQGPVDPNLTAHLQRLSQLIDGLKQTYQKPNTEKEPQDLRPDQLNAFLAHFNIKNRFDSLNPSGDYKEAPISSTTPAPKTTVMLTTTGRLTTPTTVKPLTHLPVPNLNKTRLQEHLSLSNSLEPETKVVLASALPKLYGSGGHDSGTGYSNSQIVVNRPEGSVLFTLPGYGNDKHFLEQLQYQQQQQQQQLQQQHHHQTHEFGEPKISEETLKTVLELSKQMIAAQNVPKVLPNPSYYAPQILQPVILSPPGNPFANYYGGGGGSYGGGGNYGGGGGGPAYATKQYTNIGSTHSTHKKHHRPSSSSGGGGSGGNGGYNKPSTTIIHNNVIPVHVSTTNSGEKEVIDSYGNSLGLYPPVHSGEKLNGAHGGNNGHGANGNENIYEQHMQLYGNNNNFVTTITTARPTLSVTTMSTQYAGQYPSPYSTEFTLTTPRPFVAQPTQDTIATYYTPSPHLNEHNVNHIFQTESYANNLGNLPRPLELNRQPGTVNSGYGSYQQAGLFPTTIDVNRVKIRPNSQKIESMEVEADEMINAQGYDNSGGGGGGGQLLTYSSNANNNDGANDMSAQLASSAYVEHAFKQPAYMARPTAATTTQTHNFGFGGGLNLELNGAGGGSGYGAQLPTLTKYNNINTKPNKYGNKSPDNTQLVNFNGNFISMDVFRNSILPLVGQSSNIDDLNNVEVITCQPGVRQPNTTDCTRYFVCSKKDGKVLSYSCPPYTAFNAQTRICDAQTYATCNPVAVVSAYTVNENKRIQMEAIKALQDAKKRQQAAQKAQNIANLIQQYSQALGQSVSQEQTASIIGNDEGGGEAEKDMLDSYMQQAASMSVNSQSYLVSTTTRPPPISNIAPTVKKRKYYCKEGDKIPDQTSISSYFVCYKNAQGMMKGHKMTCSKGLLFCPKTTMCTLPAKCA